jgi:predicted nucleotidyltransferase component of viral defense system
MLFFNAIPIQTLELLRWIMEQEEFSNFSLAGGTALALQIGHRQSVDLDFFGKSEIVPDQYLGCLKSFTEIRILSQSRNILILNAGGTKVDFVNYSYPLVSEVQIKDGLRLYSLPDIAAMKLTAITGRGRKRDFFDLFFLLETFTLREMMDFYNQKYEDGSEFLVAKSLSYFEDAEQDENPVIIKKVTWPTVKNKIGESVRELYR